VQCSSMHSVRAAPARSSQSFGPPPTCEQRCQAVAGEVFERCIDEALRFMPLAIMGEWEQAMNNLNGFRADEEQE